MPRRLHATISSSVSLVAICLWVCAHSVSAQIQACCPPFLVSPTAVYVGLNGNDSQQRSDNGQPTAKVITGPVQWMVMPSKAPCAQADHRFFYELPTNTGGSSDSRYGYPAPLPTPYMPAPISPVNVFNQRFAPYGTPFPNAYGATNGFYGGQTPIVPQTGGEDGYQEENGENAFGVSPTAEAYSLGYMMGQQQAGQQASQVQFSPSRATPLFPRKELTPKNPFQSPTTAPRRPIATLYGTDPGPDRVAQSQVLDSGGTTADNEGFIIDGVTRSIVSTVTPNGTEFNATDDLIAEIGVVTLAPSKRKHMENLRPDEQTDYTEGFSTTWSTSLENASTTQGPRAQAFATKLLEEGGRGINAVYTSSANNGIYSLTPPTIASSYIGFMETHLLLVILLTSLLT